MYVSSNVRRICCLFSCVTASLCNSGILATNLYLEHGTYEKVRQDRLSTNSNLSIATIMHRAHRLSFLQVFALSWTQILVHSAHSSHAFSALDTYLWAPRRSVKASRSELRSDIAGSNEGIERNGQQNLMSRGLMEEELLKGDQQSFLEMTTKEERKLATERVKKQIKERKKTAQRQRGGGGGFGAANKSKSAEHLEFKPTVDTGGFGAVVLEEGVARINGCITSETSEKLLAYIDQQLLDSMEEVAEGKEEELSRFADVLGKKKRWDMLLPLEGSSEVMQALYEIFNGGSDLGGAIEAVLGKDAALYELSALISDPGSERQAIHPDFPFQDTLPPALTSFIALQDVEADMGPTTFLPRSSSAEHHQELKDRLWDGHSRKGLLASAPNKLNCLGDTDCSLYNPMTLHCGGANRSDKRRVLFYFSFMNPSLGAATMTAGASLRPGLKKRGLLLRDIKKIVKDWKKEEANVA